MKNYYTYILTNHEETTFYIGVTSNLPKRFWQHKHKEMKGFSSKYNIVKLVYFEQYTDINNAIAREKQLKRWHREWKINLIKENNPDFNDLSADWEY